MQTAGDLVAPAAKFTAGMQDSQHHFYCRNTLFRMDIHRNTTAVVNNCDTVVFVDFNVDFLAEASQRFVDTVVDDLVDQMVQA